MTLASAKSSIMNFANKAAFTKSLLAAAGAAALLLAVPAKSEAQVVFRAQFGGPVVAVAPAYPAYDYGYGYYAQRRAYIEHEEWLRAHRYDWDDYYRGRYDRDRDYDRDRYYDRYRRDHDRDDRDRR